MNTGNEPNNDHADNGEQFQNNTLNCGSCSTPIENRYFLANGQVACTKCQEILSAYLAEKGSLLKAVLFGLGGSVLGAALWAAVVIISGWEIGIIAIFLGIIVGKAVKAGARGPGGLKFQIIAILLTFLSLCWSTLPILVNEVRKNPSAFGLDKTQEISSAAAGSDGGQTEDGKASSGSAATAILFFVFVLPAHIYILLLSNDPASGVFLLIALYEAWTINSALRIDFRGPILIDPTDMNLETAE